MDISERDIARHHLLRMVMDDRMTLADAAEKMGVSYRQSKRLYKSFVSDGISGLLHGNKGRAPVNKISDDVRSQVLSLSEDQYAKFNDSHFTEMLAKRENIVLSRETVRGIRRKEGVKPKTKRRPGTHHKRRPRKLNEGLMMLWDGSPHRWFGPDLEPCCAMAAIDDATGKIVGLFFTEVECSWAYFELLRRVVKGYGIPVSIYQDRHSSLKRNDDHWSIDEQLAGRQSPTQVGAALEALGIEPIFARSPEAKGRVERLFKTLQDRLCALLCLEGIRDIAAANEYIETFVATFNEEFSVAAADKESAWRKPKRGTDLEHILSFEYESTVGNDNAIRFSGLTIDIAPGPGKRSYAGVKTELRQLLDGSWRVYHKDILIATAPANEIGEPIRAKSRRKGGHGALETKLVYTASRTPNSIKGNSIRRAGSGGTIGATRIA